MDNRSGYAKGIEAHYGGQSNAINESLDSNEANSIDFTGYPEYQKTIGPVSLT